ncbi:hypothetical protein EIN_026010 [Entamoeba invadens IP1]|uniref:hypothetical protein n=1 Tax=Entamoeba invadens IP1 TaxID=370355 RepID=UPI0002C3DAA3|nr:hypothetical protein EIN_026010 [Entamoeba invadens IP1]ELP90762.1 hypothetical protein EIN_026010 [Entamoeba invadens IP1]|eukprot:XP_004257533.1 hypothetical protein EIN_026010 [Entamoeba invadens IP1]
MTKTKEPNKLALAKRISTSFEGEQEALCISLLIRHGVEFTLLKPRKTHTNKETSKDAIFYTISQIHFPSQNVTVDFQEIIAKIVKDSNKAIPDSKKDKSKYEKRNAISATNNFMSEILLRLNYTLTYRKTRGTSIILKMNRINSIVGNGINLTSKAISDMGRLLNSSFRAVFNTANIKRESPIKFGMEHVMKFFEVSTLLPTQVKEYITNFSLIEVKEEQNEGVNESEDKNSQSSSPLHSTNEDDTQIKKEDDITQVNLMQESTLPINQSDSVFQSQLCFNEYLAQEQLQTLQYVYAYTDENGQLGQTYYSVVPIVDVIPTVTDKLPGLEALGLK